MRTIAPALVMTFLVGTCVCAAETGLVVHYAFDEGKGTVVREARGTGAHGKLESAEWVKGDFGTALKFDGRTGSVVCKGEALKIAGPISYELWLKPFAVPGHEPGVIGKTPAVHGAAGITYYKSGECYFYIGGGGNNIRAEVPPGQWNHLAATFDGNAMRLYVNGALAVWKKSALRTYRRTDTLFIGASEGETFPGLIDSVKVYDRALSPEEIGASYLVEAQERGEPHTSGSVLPMLIRRRKLLLLDVAFPNLWPFPLDGQLEITVTHRGRTRPACRKVLKPLPPLATAKATFKEVDLEGGAHQIRTSLLDANGSSVAKSFVTEWDVPTDPGWRLAMKSGMKVLNNLTCELLHLRRPEPTARKTYRFVNPRNGWVFFAVTGKARAGQSLELRVADTAVLRLDHTSTPTVEAMRFMSAGVQNLAVVCNGRPEIKDVVVRSVPEIIHCKLGGPPYRARMPALGPYDWDFLRRNGVLDNCNVMMSSGVPQGAREPLARAWRAQGKRWFIERPKGSHKTGQEYFRTWSKGLEHPLVDGVIVDEFGIAGQKAWTEAAKLLTAAFPGKSLYPYSSRRLYGNELARDFAEAVIAQGDRLAPEFYCPEQETEEKAREFLAEFLRQPLVGWRKTIPGSPSRLVVTFGYFAVPMEFLNIHPHVDFKVYMDMQFHMLANDPLLADIYGVMAYQATSTDQETIRWCAKLYRHYCIEGKTERLTNDPYILPHIRNPDFRDGTKGWDIAAAEPSTVKAGTFKGYSRRQGRYPPTLIGDTFLMTRRSGKRPNTFSQEIRHLQPGRLYSMKMITGDHQDLIHKKTRKALHAVTIRIENVDKLPGRENSLQTAFRDHPAYRFKHPYWMNYHWRVFRARGTTAKLTVTDWKSDPAHAEPAGPIGQELMFNFIEIQPYLAE